jgi:prolyl-tRNA synthetase
MYNAYCRIFDRCGLDYAVVEASSGAMGGGVSHDFMVPAEIGSDRFVDCDGCDYAANVEKAEVGAPTGPAAEGEAELEEVDTPDKSTIEEVSGFLNASPRQMIKTLIYLADGEPVAALVRGDHDLNETKLQEALGCRSLELADDATIEDVTGAPTGFAGPVGLEDATLVCDPYVQRVADGITGANRRDAHLTGVNPGRDFEPDVTADIREAVDGDPCPRCGGGALEMHYGIEVGHVFKLGTKYSKAADATFRDDQGQERPFIMGCYGIGVDRILAAAVETMADDDGIVWPPSISPFEVVVLPLNLDNEEVREAAEQAYEELNGAGIDVLMDDRDESPGFKFKDAELVGFPVQTVIGRGYQESGKYEIQLREGGEQLEAAPEELVDTVRDALGGAL